MLKLDDAVPEPKDLDKMADLLDDAKKHTQDVMKEMDNNGKRNGDLANKIARDLPKNLQKASDAVLIAANDLANKGPSDERKEKLADAIGDLNDLIDAAHDVLPANDQPSLKSLQREVEDASKTPDSLDKEPESFKDKLTKLSKLDGVEPSDPAKEIAKNADEITDLIDKIKDAAERGKDKKPNVELAKAINSANAPILALSNASGKLLLEQAKNIKEGAAKAKDDLTDAEKKLDDLGKKVDALTREMAKGNGPPTKAQLDELADARKKFRLAAQRAKTDVDFNKNPDLFGGRPAENFREFLNDQAPDPERDHFHPDEAKDEAALLADQIKAAKDEIKNFKDNLEPQALKKEQLANKLAGALPVLGQKVNEKLLVAGSDVTQEGPGDGRQEKLDDALKVVEELRDAIGDMALGQMPSAPMRTDVDAVSDAVKKLIGKEKPNNDDKEGNAELMAKIAKQTGQTPTEAAFKTALTGDKALDALKGLDDALNKEPQMDKAGVSKNLDDVLPEVSDLSRAIEDLLEEKAQEIERDGEQTKEALQDDVDALAKLSDELKDLAKKPGDPKKLDQLKADLAKVLGHALDDISPTKNPDLFDDPTSSDLRDELQKGKDLAKAPTENPKDEAAKLADVAEKLKDKLEDYNNGLGDKTLDKSRLAKDLAKDLPKALRCGNADLLAAGKDLLAKGPEDGRKEKLQEAKDHLQNLVNTATSLLPSSEDSKPLKSVQKNLRKANLNHPVTGEPLSELRAAKGLQKFANKTGEKPSLKAVDVAENVDKAAAGLDELTQALSDPDKIAALADALDTSSPALSDLSKALGDFLAEEPKKIRDCVDAAKDNLKERKKELDKMEDDLKKLRDKLAIKKGNGIVPEIEELKAYRKKFKETAQKAIDDIDPNKNSIFGNLRSNKLVGFLGKQVQDAGDDKDEIKPEDALAEIEKLQEQIAKSKEELGDYLNNIDKDAQDQIAQVRELSSELPKYVRKLNSRLVTSARGVMATGPDDDLLNSLSSSRDQMASLLGAVAGLLPGAKKKTDLGAILDTAKKNNKASGGQTSNVKEEGAARKLDQYARQRGYQPSDAMYDVAQKCETISSSLDEVLQSLVKPEHSHSFGDAVDVTVNALKDLSEILPVMIEGEISAMKSASAKANTNLSDREKELAELNDELDKAQANVAQKGGNPDAQDIANINALRQKLNKVADNVLDDISIAKNPNLFSNPKAVKLRSTMNKIHKSTPPNGAKTSDEAKNELETLLRSIREAREGVTGFKNSLDGITSANTKIARDLAEELPRLARYLILFNFFLFFLFFFHFTKKKKKKKKRNAEDKFSRAGIAYIEDGPSEKRKEKIFETIDGIAQVVNIASSLLPSSDQKGDFKSAKDQVQDSSSSDEGTTFDSFKEMYGEALQPPRPPLAVEVQAASKEKKPNSRFKSAAALALKQQQQQQGFFFFFFFKKKKKKKVFFFFFFLKKKGLIQSIHQN